MTVFAITLWAWELTGQATTLTLVIFFSRIPALLISPLAGAIVDRHNRKILIIASDTVAALSTLGLFYLSITGELQIWHLYLTSAINGIFEPIQQLSFSASITMIVPKQHYYRAIGMISMLEYGSNIIAPSLAGLLYPVIELKGILIIDLITFCVAIGTVLSQPIPQPPVLKNAELPHQKLYKSLWRQMIFGFNFVFSRPSLWALLVLVSLFQLAHDLGGVLYSPMILARSGNNTQTLGIVSAAAGLGGVTGSVLVSIWGVPKNRVNGLLLGMIGAGLSKIVFGLSQTLFLWIPAQVCSSLNFPLMSSCRDGIWMSKVEPNYQGRVFGTWSVMKLTTSGIAPAIAGPLADRVLEPAMRPGGSLAPIFGGIFGTGSGSGIALLYVFASICLVVIGLRGYTSKNLRNLEKLMFNSDLT